LHPPTRNVGDPRKFGEADPRTVRRPQRLAKFTRRISQLRFGFPRACEGVQNLTEFLFVHDAPFDSSAVAPLHGTGTATQRFAPAQTRRRQRVHRNRCTTQQALPVPFWGA